MSLGESILICWKSSVWHSSFILKSKTLEFHSRETNLEQGKLHLWSCLCEPKPRRWQGTQTQVAARLLLPHAFGFLHLCFLKFLARKSSSGDSSSMELDLFTLDLAQQNRVLYTRFVRLLNSFKILLTHEIVQGI